MQYKKHDAFYDFEVLRNLITLALYQPSPVDENNNPKNGILWIGFEAHTENTQNVANLNQILAETPNYKQRLIDAIVKINKYNKKRLQDIRFVPLQKLVDQVVEKWTNTKDIKDPEELGTMFGFNSQHYDVPILADVYETYHESSAPLTTENIRNTSDQIIVNKVSPYRLFEKGSLKQQRLSKLQINPYFIDIQIINEKLRHTGLKRLSAQSGLKILTSQKLKGDNAEIETFDDLCELIGYNVSDVFDSQDVFEKKEYQNPYNTGVSMLKRYEEQFKGLNLKRDTTSAKFIEYVIAPTREDKLVDDKVLNLIYPMYNGYLDDKNKPLAINTAKEYGLDETLDYNLQENFDKLVKTILLQIYSPNQPNLQLTDLKQNEIIQDILNGNVPEKFKSLKPLFEFEPGHRKIYYKDDEIQIDLVEFLKSNYLDKFNKKYQTNEFTDVYDYLNAFNWKDVSQKEFRAEIVNNLPQRLKGGANILMPNKKPVILKVSIGGAHGNFLDRSSYEEAYRINMMHNKKRNKVVEYYTHLAKQIIDDNNIDYSNTLLPEVEFPNISNLSAEELAPLLAKFTKKKPTKKSPSGGFVHNEPKEIIDLIPSNYVAGTYKAAKFKKEKPLPKTNKYTSTIDTKNAVHIDISSYYPTLLSLLKVFISNKLDENGNRIDLYGELLKHRLKIKFSLPSDITTWTDEDFLNKAIELLDKLLLNSASGAADATYDNNILVPNKIMRMRIAGQVIITILAFLISEANGIPNSINTDGIYSHDINLDTANKIIQDWAKTFKLSADGELIDHFISKDTNNRIEIVYSKKADALVVASASGGTISHHEGPDLQKNVALPTIVDNSLVEYMFKNDKPLEYFDRNQVHKYIQNMIDSCKDDLEKYKQEYYKLINNPNTPIEVVGDLVEKTGERLAETLKHFQHIVVSNTNKQRFITYENEHQKPIYPSDINRVFFIDPDLVQEKREESNMIFNGEEYPTKMKLIVINKQTKKTIEEAEKIAQTTGILNRPDVQDALDAKAHIAFMAITNINDDWYVSRQNQDLRYINTAILDCLDVDAYTDLVKIQWDNWAEIHMTNY